MDWRRRRTTGLWLAAFLLPWVARPAAASDQTAFLDGGSVAVAPSGATTVATLPTTFASGDNFVIAIVNLQVVSGSGDSFVAPGALRLSRAGGGELMSNFYRIRLSSGILGVRKAFPLIGIDTGAGSSPSYVVDISWSGTLGLTAEAKVLALAGVTGAQIRSALGVEIFSSDTTIETLSTTLPAGDNVVLAVTESTNTGNSSADLSYVRLNGTAPLAQSEYSLTNSDVVPEGVPHLIPYLDVGAGSAPAYSVSAAEASNGLKVEAVAKIVAFSRGARAAAYGDGPATLVGTSETTLHAAGTTFAAGSEVAVIASQQFLPQVFATRAIASGLLRLQQNDDTGTQRSNQYELNIREPGIGDAGEAFGLLGMFTATPASPEYEVKATSSDVNLGAEAKILALAVPGTTEVTLSSFTAQGEDSSVLLEWQTASELDNLGFNLYRATSESGPYEKITSSLIPGLGSSPIGARYSYADSGLTNGVRYFYELEDVETTGRTGRHGPVSAIPLPGATTDPEDDAADDPGTDPGDGGGEPARTTYGDPSAVSLRVLRRDSSGVDLELLTGGFSATPAAGGSMRLEIPGFETTGEPGTPALPVTRTLLEAVAGRRVGIRSIEPSDVVSFAWPRPALAQAPEMLVGRDGTVRAGFRRVRPTWVSRRPYPAQLARILTTAFQGETKKALVELAPLRWNASTGKLVLARRLRVRVAFEGIEPAELPLGGSRGRFFPRQGARPSRSAREVFARLLARDSGLYAVRFEDVFRSRRRAVAASRLRLTRLGQTVAFHVEPDPSRFAPGSVLYFLSQGGSSSAHANEAVYELALGSGGTTMPLVSSPPAGAVLTEAVEHRSWERNRYYLHGLVEAPDRWLWDSVLSGTPPKRFTFSLAGVAASSELAVIRVWLQGASDFEASPDHHVRLSVNDSFVAEASWDGRTVHRLEAVLSPGLLHDGDNHITIDNVADTAAAYSAVYLDRFSLDLPRTLAAEAGRFEATFGSSGTATVAGLGTGSRLLDTTETTARWVVGAVTGPDSLAFTAEAARRYLAVSPGALLTPGIRWPSIAGDLRTTSNRADYLLLAPRELLPAATRLLQLREEQGLETRAVALEEVYDAFGYGEKSPEAIRDFIAYAYHRWTPPSPRYVLLLGDSTFDPKDYAGTGVKDLLPVFLFKSTWLWTASDPAYAAVNGDDFLPDLAVGRLPASSLEQARSLVAKLVAFEGAGFDPEAPAVLVADDPDRAGNFEKDADEIASGPLASWTTEKIYLGRLGTEATRSAIVSAFDRGASLMSYIGHGGIPVWATEGVLLNEDLPKLSPQARQPLLFTMNCLNGYFFAPGLDSLAEALVEADDKGAIAAVSPSGLSLDEAAHAYHRALVIEIASGRHARLGDALLAAQGRYAETGYFPELLRVYNLLGDPALRLR